MRIIPKVGGKDNYLLTMWEKVVNSGINLLFLTFIIENNHIGRYHRDI